MGKMILLFVQYSVHFFKALMLTLSAPLMIYRGFTGHSNHHWLEWCALFFASETLFSLAIGYTRNGLALDHFIAPFFVTASWLMATAAAALLERFAGTQLHFLAWRPAVVGGGFKRAPSMGSGAAKAGETLLRGAAIVDGAALQAHLYHRAKPEELAELMNLGGVHVPFKGECEHFLIEGKTGAGKTQAINAMLRTVRRRKQPAIIADPAGGYLARFFAAGDFVLNPFDARDAGWNPFKEIRADYDFQRLAKAAIPDTSGDSNEWHFYAQNLLAETMRAMHKKGNHSIKKLLYYVQAANQGELAELLAGTPAAVITQKGNEKMLSNTRAIAALYLNVWTYLPEEGTFSVREWVAQAGAGDSAGWLYLSYRDDQMALLKNLVATFLELAIVEGLSLSEQPNRRLWYIMDELDSLGKVTSLRAGLTKLRKYGGACVSGLQTIAQLRDTYGKEEAQTLLSCMSTKLVLAAGDGETAEYFEKELGEQEVARMEQSHSTSSSANGNSTSSQQNIRRDKQAAVLASEIQKLPNLQGFLKLVGLPIARVSLNYTAMADVVAPFTHKE
jgi:hypothetical protein